MALRACLPCVLTIDAPSPTENRSERRHTKRRNVFFTFTTLAFGALAATVSLGQQAANQFEVASIKPSDPEEPNTRRSSTTFGAGGSFTASYTTLRALITVAFDVRDLQISGAPGWIGTERYDIEAKIGPREWAALSTDPRDLTDEQRKAGDDRTRERLRSLLAERFGLVVHRETREQTVLLLTYRRTDQN